MACHAAMMDKPLAIPPTMRVEDALAEMKKRGVDCAAVVAPSGIFEGVFSVRDLIKNLLPVSVAMADGIQLDVTLRAAPGVAKRLRNAMALPVSDFINRKPAFVYPQTPIWEGINAIVTQGAPVIVLEGENKKFFGMITDSSAFNELLRMQQGEV
jgi:CBS domain-containing protein